MEEPLYAVYGANGMGRQVMPLARAQMARYGVSPDRLVFIDDNPALSHVNGHPVLRYEEFLSRDASRHFAATAIADSQVREKIAGRYADDGIEPWTVTASNSIVMDDVQLGKGAILSVLDRKSVV